MSLPAPYLHTDGRYLHLGKGPAKIDDPRRFMLQDVLPRVTPPASANWYKGVTSFGTMLNNVLGDCVVAAIGHAEQVATLNTSSGELTPPDAAIENVYAKACGYVPGKPNSDNGCVIVDTLNWVRRHGIGVRKDDPSRHHKPTLYAYADPDPGDIAHVKQAIATFGILDIGLQLPITAQKQVGALWTIVGDPNTDWKAMPGSWGGHSIVVCAYDAHQLIGITWGQLQAMDWGFFSAYCDEAHALLMHQWMATPAIVQSGFDLAAMEAKLKALSD